ncbi:MAG: undecaprenyldiphospho-muramoylpentapeptide beta-N-acetylglucosaminyltransferase [Bacteroidetes bacterium]|nr:MAG: undecaprenyldiphospho-muramoylpentapeptide beta-N-acetylglucosaminyltransferase [Bacteroidota bacterium]
MKKNVLLKIRNPKIIISGGGTGGHVFPAIAIADEIRRQCPGAEIRFVGAKGKIEMEKVPKAGYPIDGLWISGFQRRLTLQNLMFPLKLASSLWTAWRILRRFRPDVVVGVGGYASGPTLEVAARLGIPVLIQEQNSFPGITNRLLASKARKICVAYEQMDRWFPADKILYTGNPVREDIFQNLAQKRAEALTYFDLSPGKKTIFVFGGSLGARTINDAMVAAEKWLADRSDVQVLWQTGRLYFDEMRQSATAALPGVEIRPFIDRMDLAYALADVIIGRAGALTISELCWAGKPAVLVPSPNVAEDHQTKNARALTDREAAVMVADVRAKAEMIPAALEILDNPERAKQLGQKIFELKKANAAGRIAAEVLALAEQ